MLTGLKFNNNYNIKLLNIIENNKRVFEKIKINSNYDSIVVYNYS